MDKRLKFGGLAVAAVVVLLVVVLATRSSESSSSSGANSGRDSGAVGSATPGASTAGGSASTALAGPSDGPTTSSPAAPIESPPPTTAGGNQPSVSEVGRPQPPTTLKPIPVQATVSNNSGLSNGSKVSIHVTPDGGSKAFAFEAWLCRGNETFTNDSDVRPSLKGKCLPEPLQPDTDNHTEVIGQEPYTSLDGVFRVGVGTKTFRTQSGSATVACGPGNPCQLVLKLQYPDGFGFRAFPLTFG